jgi:riboflavin biosynthesis pyrimidine reductase
MPGTYHVHRTQFERAVEARLSLDGRIALRDPSTGMCCLPAELRSDNDLRLLLELEAQADCLITNSSYLRAIAAGRLDDILQVGTSDGTRDLAEWRSQNGLSRQPAVVIASASLDFPMPPSLSLHAQRVLIATGEATPVDKLKMLRAQGYEVIIAGKGRSVEGKGRSVEGKGRSVEGKGRSVEGAALTSALAGLGFRSIFLLAGPRMLETALRDGVLSRLYVTIAHLILGGESFDTLISGPELGSAGRLRMASLYYDGMVPDHVGQWFAQFKTNQPNDPQVG